jgi:predicted P-loop ATPase
VPAFDPVEHYLSHLPEWDGQDHIGMFADSVVTNDAARFRELLRMWYVGMIQTYRHPNITNHIVITLYSAGQGIGKTNFVDRILPPELQEAIYQGMIRDQKDSLEKIATCLLISIDELNHYKREEMQQLKELITRKYIDFRVNYDRFGHRHYHRASFMATCNSTHFMSDPSGNRRFHIFEVAAVNMDYMPDYPQLFAQIMHLIDTGFKYYFTSAEQEELSAYSYQFENNPAEYDFLVKYVRKYPGNCKNKKTYTSKELLQKLKFFNQEYVIDKAAEIRMGKALARRGIEFVRGRNSKEYECHILTAEQAEYIAQHKDMNRYIDIDFEVNVPREILIAGDDAKIADICKAREFLDQTGGDFKEAQRLYDAYIKDDREIKYTNNDTLPF